MPKYYITLIDRPNRRMRIPIKAMLNPYNQQAAFCAGMPQFFGGTSAPGDTALTVLQREVNEESRDTLALTTANPRHLLTDGAMSFYYALEGQWANTHTPWGPPQNLEQQEMDRLVVVDLSRFATNMNDAAIIAELAQQCGSPLNTPGAAQFQQSATRQAFIRVIRGFLAGNL